MSAKGPRFGLDVGHASVKLVRWEPDGVRTAERELPANADAAARYVATVSAVRELAKELGVRGKDEVHVAVPRSEAVVKQHTLPNVGEAELEQLIQLQASRDLPFDLSEVVLTWASLGRSPEGGQEITLAAVRRESVEELKKILAEAGCRAGSLEVSTQAAARTLALHGPKDADEVLLVDVGRDHSDIVVLELGRLAFTRSASVGFGKDDPQWQERLVQEVLRSLVAARAERESEAHGPPDALLIAGGGAGLQDLKSALQARIGFPPQVLDALGDGDPLRAARFVVALGVADPRPVPRIPSLDLAHRGRAQAAAATRERRTRWSLLAGACVLLLAAGGKYVMGATETRKDELLAARDALAPDVQRVRSAEKELAFAEEWSRTKGRELEVLLAVSKALPADEAYLTQLRWDGEPLRLNGRAKDLGAVSRFINALGQDPRIERTSFETARERTGRDAIGLDFTASARLIPVGGAQ